MTEPIITIRILHGTDGGVRDALYHDLLQRLEADTLLRPHPRPAVRTTLTRIDPNVPVRKRNVWFGVRRAWIDELKNPIATHLCFLQDDVLPSWGFLDALYEVVHAYPDRIVGLLAAKRFQREVFERGQRYYASEAGTYGSAWIAPLEWVRACLAWNEVCVERDFPHDDSRMCLFDMAEDRLQVMTAPSLVEHVGTTASTLGHGGTPAAVWLEDVRHLNFREKPDVLAVDRGWWGKEKHGMAVLNPCRTGALRDLQAPNLD